MDYGKLYRVENESRETTHHAIDALLKKGADDLYMKYVMNKIPDFLSEIYYNAFVTLVDETSLTFDKGDSMKEIYRFWKEESEPIGKIKKKEDEEEKDVVKELETSKPSNFASPRFRRNSVGVTPRRRASVSVSGGLSSSLVGRRRGTVADSVGGGGAIAKLSGRKKEVPFTYNEYYSDPSAITRFFEKPFEGEEEHKNKLKPAKAFVSKHDFEPIDEEKEKKYRKNNKEKLLDIQKQLEYDRKKEEQKREQEEKRKELSQNLKKRPYTFKYNADFLYLKPIKESDIHVNDIIEVNTDIKKKPVIEHVEQKKEIMEVEVEIKELGDQKQLFEKTKTSEKEVVGLKPQPPLKDVLKVSQGVTMKLGKGKPLYGGTFKIKGRISKKEFDKLHKVSIARGQKKSNVSQKEQKKFMKKKEEKEKKYRRTVENWKNDLKKGLMKKGLNFDPDLLIELIMTEEDAYTNKKKIEKRKERKIKEEKMRFYKKKFKEISSNPEKYFNRITAFSKDLGTKKPRSGQIPDPMFMNKFQKEINDFNKRIIENPDHYSGNDIWELQKRESTQESKKRMFNLPRSKSGFVKRNLRDRKKPSTQIKTKPLTRGIIRVQSSTQLKSKFSMVGNQLRRSEMEVQRVKRMKDFQVKSRGSQSRMSRSRKSWKSRSSLKKSKKSNKTAKSGKSGVSNN